MDGLVPSSAWRFDRFVLDLSIGGLFRLSEAGTREPVSVGGRALDVLATLVTRAGELVAKQTIMDAVWPGVAVEEKNLTVQISALRRALDQDRAGDSVIQTVAGRGYRLAVPAERIIAVESPEASGPSPPPAELMTRRFGARLGLAALLGAIVIALTVGLVSRASTSGRSFNPPRFSVVVLPFDDLGGDQQDNRLSRTLTKDLVTDLARVPLLTIVAAPGKETDPRKVGEEAGVRHVVDGSIRRDGDRLRATARLVAAETGTSLWSERFEEPFEGEGDALVVIVRRLGQALNVALVDSESARGKIERPTNPDAFDLLLQARSLGLHTLGPPEWALRMELLERAVRMDRSSIVARTQLANGLIRRYTFADGNDLERAAALLHEAAAINPNNFGLLESSAFLHLARGEMTEALAANRRIIEEFPDTISAYADVGYCLIYLGRAEEALPMFQTAIRRDPRSHLTWDRYGVMGFALLMLGRDEEAIASIERAAAANPAAHPFVRANWNIRLAGAHTRLGHLDLARRALAEANRIWPYDTVRMHWPEDTDSPVYAAQIARWQDALRAAGHRDHADEDADFGVASDAVFRSDVVGFTPTTVPGAKLVRTDELKRLLDDGKPLVIDSLLYSWGRSVPGAVGLKFAGIGAGVDDVNQERLRREMQKRTHGDLAMPIVAVGFNSERFDGRNLALRLVALGYTNVRWYRGGREAWEAAGLPETRVAAVDW